MHLALLHLWIERVHLGGNDLVHLLACGALGLRQLLAPHRLRRHQLRHRMLRKPAAPNREHQDIVPLSNIAYARDATSAL